MAESKVRSGELKRKAEELAMLNSKYRQEVEKMVQHEIDLAGMWEGDAQKAFRQAFNTDKHINILYCHYDNGCQNTGIPFL